MYAFLRLVVVPDGRTRVVHRKLCTGGPLAARTSRAVLCCVCEREIFINQQEITTLTVIWARQLVSPQPKLGPVP